MGWKISKGKPAGFRVEYRHPGVGQTCKVSCFPVIDKWWQKPLYPFVILYAMRVVSRKKIK